MPITVIGSYAVYLLPKNVFAPPDMAKIRVQAGICPPYPHQLLLSRSCELRQQSLLLFHTEMTPQTPSEIERESRHDNDIKSVSMTSTGKLDAIKALDPEALEIFQRDVDGVEFRTVSWQRATVVFLKINFAMSILTTPNALATFGAVGGGLSLVAWIVLNTCMLNLQFDSSRYLADKIPYRHRCPFGGLPQQSSGMS